MKPRLAVISIVSLTMAAIAAYFFSSRYNNIGAAWKAVNLLLMIFYSLLFVVSTKRLISSFQHRKNGIIIALKDGGVVEGSGVYLSPDGLSFILQNRHVNHVVNINGIKSIEIVYNEKKEILTPKQLIKRIKR